MNLNVYCNFSISTATLYFLPTWENCIIYFENKKIKLDPSHYELKNDGFIYQKSNDKQIPFKLIGKCSPNLRIDFESGESSSSGIDPNIGIEYYQVDEQENVNGKFNFLK
jgi:hypothetical protein